MGIEQWLIGKLENEKQYYFTDIDREGKIASWSAKIGQARKFEDAMSANEFKKNNLQGRTDVYLIHTITYSWWPSG